MQTVTYAGKIFEPPGRRRIFENLQKIPEENCKNWCIFAYFAKIFQNHAVNFRAFGRKTQLFGKFWENFESFWWKFNWIFLYFLWKFVAKNRNFGNNIIFIQQFFSGSGGGGFKPTPPLRTPLNAEEEHTDLNNFGAGGNNTEFVQGSRK